MPFFTDLSAGVAAREAWSANLSAQLSAFYDQAPSVLDPVLPRAVHDPKHHRPSHEEHDPVVLHNHRRFDLIGPVGPRCAHLESYGRGDEEKRACQLSGLQPGCHVISIGSKRNWGFEEAIFSGTPCRIDTFDCTTPADTLPPPAIRNRTHFHKVCLAERSYVRRSRIFEGWSDLLQRIPSLHGRAPDFLKMDIEGYEYAALQSIVDARRLWPSGGGEEPPALPSQVAVELHFKTHMKGLPFYGRLVTPAEIALFVDHMWRHGRYAVINRHDNQKCDHCTEILIARVPSRAGATAGASSAGQSEWSAPRTRGSRSGGGTKRGRSVLRSL